MREVDSVGFVLRTNKAQVSKIETWAPAFVVQSEFFELFIAQRNHGVNA
jgi:hypothetical protein